MNIEEINKDVLAQIDKNSYKKIKDGLYLKESQIEILDRYEIDYNSVSDLKELIFIVEDMLEETYYPEDLEGLSLEFSEFNYYNNTNK